MKIKSAALQNSLLFFLLLALGVWTFLPSFNLALFGDDWLAFVRYLYHLGPSPETPGRWNHLNYFLTPYGPQDIFMGLLQKAYGYQSSLYYLTSYLLRLAAALSLLPLVNYLTRSKLAAFFAVIFFLVTTTGLDTTNWVFNMPSYISIFFLNIFLYFYIKSRDQNKKLIILAAGLYYFAYILAPIRMHGILPFILSLEIFWLVKNRSLSSLKFSLLRLGIIFFTFVFINLTGQSSGAGSDWNQRFYGGVGLMLNMLGQGRFDFLFYPVVILGETVFPSILFNYERLSQSFWSLLLVASPILICFSLLLTFFSKDIPLFKKYAWKIIFPFLILWTALAIFVTLQNYSTFGFVPFFIFLNIGGYLLIIFLILLILFLKTPYSNALFVSFSWTIASYIAAWWSEPMQIYPSIHRYLIPAAVGISIFLATIICLGEGKKRVSLFILLSTLILIQMFSTRSYFNNLDNFRSQEISDKIWSAFPYIPEIGQGKELRLFYFEASPDNLSQAILHDVITFGFPTHIGLLYKYYLHYSPSNNVATNNTEELVSAVTDGRYLTAHGHKAEPIGIEYIYAFRLEGKSSLTDITAETREKLKSIIEQYKKNN